MVKEDKITLLCEVIDSISENHIEGWYIGWSTYCRKLEREGLIRLVTDPVEISAIYVKSPVLLTKEDIRSYLKDGYKFYTFVE